MRFFAFFRLFQTHKWGEVIELQTGYLWEKTATTGLLQSQVERRITRPDQSTDQIFQLVHRERFGRIIS